MIDPYDDDLDWIDGHANDEEPLPAPADASEADRLLRLLARDIAEDAQIEAVFGAEIDKLTRRRDDLRAAPRRRIERLERSLEAWAVAVRAEGRKSVKLPHGTVRTREGSTSVEIEDADALVEWWSELAASSPVRPVVQQPDPPAPRPSKSNIKTLVQSGVLVAAELGGGRAAVVTPDGEVVPGVVMVSAPPSAKIETVAIEADR